MHRQGIYIIPINGLNLRREIRFKQRSQQNKSLKDLATHQDGLWIWKNIQSMANIAFDVFFKKIVFCFSDWGDNKYFHYCICPRLLVSN